MRDHMHILCLLLKGLGISRDRNLANVIRKAGHPYNSAKILSEFYISLYSIHAHWRNNATRLSLMTCWPMPLSPCHHRQAAGLCNGTGTQIYYWRSGNCTRLRTFLYCLCSLYNAQTAAVSGQSVHYFWWLMYALCGLSTNWLWSLMLWNWPCPY